MLLPLRRFQAEGGEGGEAAEQSREKLTFTANVPAGNSQSTV
jgi:hypothetical protein